jgi:N-acetylneuraminate lyase
VDIMVSGGIYAALPSPFDADGALDRAALVSLVGKLLDRGVEGFYVGGSTGECFLLDEAEREAALEAVVKAAAGRAPVIAHVGALSTAAAVRLARHAASRGVAAVSATPPFYFTYGLDEIGAYYADIAQASGLPVLVYNIPAFSGRNFGADGLDRLLSIPGVAGLKHTSMNLHELERIRSRHPDKLLLSGYDEVFLPALSMGSDGMIGSTVNLMPELFLGIRAAFKAGDMARAGALQAKVNAAVEVLAAVPFFPALKCALASAGSPCGECRKPFLPLGEEAKATITEKLTALGVIGKGSR